MKKKIRSVVLWLWGWAFSESKIFKRRTIWISHSQRVDRWLSWIVLSDAVMRCPLIQCADLNGVKLRGSAEEWYSQHFRVPGCPCRTADLFTNLSTLEHTRWSRKYSCCLTGNQRKPFNKGVMWSNFPAPLTILEAKFCTAWSLFRLNWLVLLQTEEQQNSLLNTNTFMIIIKASL